MSITNNISEHRDESLTTRNSTLAMMTEDWIALDMTLQRKSRKCKSRRRLSWISTFLDKPDLNPVMAKYANPAVSEVHSANIHRCTCSKYRTSCLSTPKHGNPPTSNLPPQATTERLPQPHSHHITLPCQPSDGAAHPRTRQNCNQTPVSFVGAMALSPSNSLPTHLHNTRPMATHSHLLSATL